METVLQTYVAALGRVLMAAIFLMSGIGKIFDFSGTVGYMESAGMPMAPLFLVGAILLEIVGGVLLITGFQVRVGVVLLILFLIPATLIFHDFWTIAPDAPERRPQMINFMKNLSILGGLLFVLSQGAGGLSVDAWRKRNAG